MAEAIIPLMEDLLKAGDTKMMLLVRHGARHYDPENPSREFDMPLTEQGKQDANALGTKLPASSPSSLSWRFISSPVGRCVETAHQVERGCNKSGAETVTNVPHTELSNCYFPDLDRVIHLCAEHGDETVARSWMNGELSPEIAQPPDDALADLLGFMSGHLSDEGPCFAATHDMTVHLARRVLGTQHERVHYLNGVLLFERDGKLEMSNGETTVPITSSF